MLHGEFTRGTTPTQIFPLPGDLKLSDFLDFTITYRQKGKNILIKRKSDTCRIDDINSDRVIVLVLSQADTLMFDPRIKVVEVQIKGETTGSDVFTLGQYRLRLNDCFDENEFDLDD